MSAGTRVLREHPVADSTIPRLELREWAEQYDLVAGITTREHGFSLGLWSEEPVGQVLGRWRAFGSAFTRRFPAVVLSHQVHGNVAAWHEGIPAGWHVLDGFDAHATADQGLLLAISVADCIPVYLAIPGSAIALVHAGWRGVSGEVLKATVGLLAQRVRGMRSQIVMHCGVGICGSCYEVGSEVAERLTGVPATGQAHVDLRGLLARAAAALGIECVTTSPWCSAHDRDRFFSHRASNGADGRMVAYLGMPMS